MSNEIFSAFADQLEYDWKSIARPEQLPPSGDWSIWLVLAGRGFGKTRCGAEWVRGLAEAASVSRIALVGPTAADVRDTMIESGLLAIAPNSNRPIWEPSKRRLIWPNGVQAWAFSSEEPDRLRGPQFEAGWCDELCAWKNVNETWDMLQFGMRLGRRPRQVITTTPKPIPLLRSLLKRDDVVVTKGSTKDNIKNLAPTFLQTIVSRYQGTRLGRQELDAEILDDTPGALWTRDLIEASRAPANAAEWDYRRIVVAIDPAISAHAESDETGIIVAGIDWRDEAYVLEDLSGRFQPHQWATRAIAALKWWQGDRIVAEINQGGAMVEATLRAIDSAIPFRATHASRGKAVRAEPISSLWESGRAHIVGALPELEDQMASFAPGMSTGSSPDRLDAMVWALTDLVITQRPQFVFA